MIISCSWMISDVNQNAPLNQQKCDHNQQEWGCKWLQSINLSTDFGDFYRSRIFLNALKTLLSSVRFLCSQPSHVLSFEVRCSLRQKHISVEAGRTVTSENMASAPSMTNQPLACWRSETGIRSYSFWVRLLFDTWLWGMRKTMAAMVDPGSRVLMF